MLDAAKIRTTKTVLRHAGMPALVLGCSMLIGVGINQLARPAISQWHQNAQANQSNGSQTNSELTGRLMAAELMAVEPVTPTQPNQPNTTRRGSFVKAGNVDTAGNMHTAGNVAAAENQLTAAAHAPAMSTPTLAASVSTAPTVNTAPEAVVTQAVLNNAPQDTASSHATIPAGYRLFNGRLIRPARTLTMVTTAYSPDERSCGPNADGTTASGKSVWTNGMKMVAADTRLLPFGTLVSVPGYYDGQPVPVLDRGGAIKGHRLDMLYPTHEIAITWGRKTQKVTIWEYVD